MKTTSFSHKDITENPIGTIHDYYTVAAWLGVKPSTISHVLHHMTSDERQDVYAQQHRIAIKKGKDKVRVVYQSKQALDFIQKRLLKEFNDFTAAIPNEHLWAYIPGKNPRNLPKLLQSSGVIAHFDIVGYFDNITFGHISESLQALGMSRQGANLATRFCVVERNTPRGKVRTLQQGSAASSPISNLVGFMFFDRDIMAWLDKQKEGTQMDLQYHRYCDNVYLGVKGAVPLDFIQRFKEFVHGLMRSRGFATHKWNVTTNSNPKRAQKVLGIVVNHIPRVEKEYFEKTRAILFNACIKGIEYSAAEFFHKHPEPPKMEDSLFGGHVNTNGFLAKLGGRANYIGDVNSKHKLQLTKLRGASVRLDAWRAKLSFAGTPDTPAAPLPEHIFTVFHEYQNSTESTDAYLKRLEQALAIPLTALAA